MKSMNDSQPEDIQLDQYLQLKNLLTKCKNILDPSDFSTDEYNQYSLEFRRYNNFLRQINLSKSLGDQKNVLVNLENIKTNLNYFLKKSGNSNLITDQNFVDPSNRNIEVPLLMERLQSLNDDQKQNEDKLNDISKGFEDVSKYMKSLKQKRKKTTSKKNNVLPLHSFNLTIQEKKGEDLVQDPRLQYSHFNEVHHNDDQSIDGYNKSDFEFEKDVQGIPQQNIIENNIIQSSVQDDSQISDNQQEEQDDSQISDSQQEEQDQSNQNNINDLHFEDSQEINEIPSVQIDEQEKQKSETYKSVQDEQYHFNVVDDNFFLESQLKMLKKKEKELSRYLKQIKNSEFDGLYSFEQYKKFKTKKQLDKNYKLKLLSDLSYQIELRERKNDNKLKINNKCHIERHNIDEDGVLRLITIVQEQIMQKRSELTKLRQETERLYDEKNILNQFFEQKKLDVINDKKVKIEKDQNREFYDRAQIFIEQKNKLELENDQLKKVLQNLKKKIKELNN